MTIIMHDSQEHVALARNIAKIEMLITFLLFHDRFSAVLCMVFWSIFHC